jgi:hypothetical protein
VRVGFIKWEAGCPGRKRKVRSCGRGHCSSERKKAGSEAEAIRESCEGDNPRKRGKDERPVTFKGGNDMGNPNFLKNLKEERKKGKAPQNIGIF